MARTPRRVPTRTCVACRTARAKRDLVRVVRTPAGAIELDETGRVAGRGAYLCRDAACWETALGKGALERALGAGLPPALREALRAAAPGVTTTMTTNGMTKTTTGGEPGGEE